MMGAEFGASSVRNGLTAYSGSGTCAEGCWKAIAFSLSGIEAGGSCAASARSPAPYKPDLTEINT